MQSLTQSQAHHRSTGTSSKGPKQHAGNWQNVKEIGRLTDGRVGDVTGTNTIFFKHPSELPEGRTATYLRVVADLRPQKADPYRVRWTVGGDRLDYHGEVSTPASDMNTAKLLFNSTISTPGARFMCLDIKDFTSIHRWMSSSTCGCSLRYCHWK